MTEQVVVIRLTEPDAERLISLVQNRAATGLIWEQYWADMANNLWQQLWPQRSGQHEVATPKKNL